MDSPAVASFLIAGRLLLGVAVGALTIVLLRRPSNASQAAREAADVLLADARREAEDLRNRARDEAQQVRLRASQLTEDARTARDEAEADIQTMRSDLREQRLDLERRGSRLAEREEPPAAEEPAHDDRDGERARRAARLDRRFTDLENLERERREVSERTAELTAEQAKAELVAAVEAQAKREPATLVRDIEREAQEQGDARAREIITLAIQRLASEQTAESVVSVLHLPADEMKGRIIGREGRDLRAFAQ